MSLVEINYSNNRKIFELGSQLIAIELDECDRKIYIYETFWNSDEEDYETGESIGHIEMEELDSGDHRILWMGLDKYSKKYLRKGIGSAALTFFKDYFGGRIFAGANDGISRQDGSHLTNDAPAFIEKMRKAGIVELDHEEED